MIKTKNTERIYQTIIGTILGIVCITCIYPLIYVLSLSLTTSKELMENAGFLLFPRSPTLTAYKAILNGNSIFMNSLWVSVLRTVVGAVTSLVASVMVGYTLSRRTLPYRKLFIIVNLITILFSGGLIPTYLVVNYTGLIDTFWALIIPGLINGWNCLIFKQFFENIPSELEQSADIDGADEINMMFKIFIPMSTPVMAAIGLFCAVGHWNSWFDASIYIRSANLKPLQLLLQNMLTNPSAVSDLSMRGGLSQETDFTVSPVSLKMAVAVTGTVPILMVYPFLQKYFVKGVYSGSVKG